MSSNTRLTRYDICLHVSVIMSAVVLVSNLSLVNSSTTVATATSPQVTLTTTKVTEVPSAQSSTEATSPSGNDTTAATTTLQSGSIEETTTTQPGETSQSITNLITTTTNALSTTQSPETTTDNTTTQSSTDAMTSETTSISVTTQTTTTINTPETATTSDTITTETPHNATDSTSESVTVTATTQDPKSTYSSISDTTQTSSESTEATSTISTDATNQKTTTTQGSGDTTSSVSNTATTTISLESTETSITSSSEVTTKTTTTQEISNTNSVSDTTTEAPSPHSTETTNQTTMSTSVDNTTITQPTTAAITTTQPTTTTTATTTTTKSYQIMPVYPDTENAVLEFTFELRFTDCKYNKTTIETKLSVVSSSVNGCKYIRVKSIKSCSPGRRKRSASTPKVSVDTVFGVDAQRGASSGSNVSDALYSHLSTVDNIDANYLNETKDNFTGALTSKQICDSDVCTSALVGRPGFVCVAEPSKNNTQRCAIIYYCDHQPIDCGKHGHCYVGTEIQSERVSYSSKCRCTEEEFFRYEGTRCTERVMTWELAVIICASASGALILLLLFIIIVMCCRNASSSADVSFEESELMYTHSGIASANGRNGRDASKGVENQGYMEVRDTSGSWKPEASANTYAHIESKLREHNYDMQIKRPQVTQFRKSDEITEF